MRAKPLIMLIVTAVLVGLAWKVSQDKAPQTEVARGPLYPGLLEQLNDVSRLALKSASHEVVLEGRGETWKVASQDGFPAIVANVKRAILQVASVVLVEPKTTRPESYARIGVEDVKDDKAGGILIEASGADGKPLFSLIVGKTRGVTGEQHYVRRVGEAQAWLVGGTLNLEADPIRWLEAGIVDIDTARVRQLSLSAPGEPMLVIRKDTPKDNFFALAEVPAGFEAKSRATVSAIGALLLDLRFNDVMAAEKVAGLTPVRTAEVQTFDGVVVTIEQFDVDGRVWSRFAFRHDPALAMESAAPAAAGDDAAKDAAVPAPTAETGAAEPGADEDSKAKETPVEEVARLSAATSGWVYVLPDYKQRMIGKKLADLIQKPQAKTDAKPAS